MNRFFKGNGFAIVLIAILAIDAIRSSDFSNPVGWLWDTLLYIPGIILGITVHEWAHAFVAYKLGDTTPKLQGRVSLNPIRHIDPIGLIALLFIHFGWGKPVMVNPYAFKHPRRDNILTDVAGITLNFIVAFILMLIFRLYWGSIVGTSTTDIESIEAILQLFSNAIWMNLVLMLFNLLPVPPLDGFGIVTEALNMRGKPGYDIFYNAGFPILMLLIILDIPSKIISPLMIHVLHFIYNCIYTVMPGPEMPWFTAMW